MWYRYRLQLWRVSWHEIYLWQNQSNFFYFWNHGIVKLLKDLKRWDTLRFCHYKLISITQCFLKKDEKKFTIRKIWTFIISQTTIILNQSFLYQLFQYFRLGPFEPKLLILALCKSKFSRLVLAIKVMIERVNTLLQFSRILKFFVGKIILDKN